MLRGNEQLRTGPSSLGDSLLFFNPSSLWFYPFPRFSCGVDNPLLFLFTVLLIVCLLPNPREDIGGTINRFFGFSSLFISRSSHTIESRSIEKKHSQSLRDNFQFRHSLSVELSDVLLLSLRRKLQRIQGRFLEKGQSFRIEDAQTVLLPAFHRPFSLDSTINQQPDKTVAINTTQIHL